MSKVILTLDSMPKCCDECPLFINHFGQKAYCAMHAKYTAEEVFDEEGDGNLAMYYHGCFSERPKACPLETVEEKETNTTENDSAWDFHWDGIHRLDERIDKLEGHDYDGEPNKRRFIGI